MAYLIHGIGPPFLLGFDRFISKSLALESAEQDMRRPSVFSLQGTPFGVVMQASY